MDVTTEVRVRYAETDQMGWVHHRHYLVWCEIGRTAFLAERGEPYSEIEQRGFLLPVSRVEFEYRRPATYDDVVAIRTWVKEVRSRDVSFGHEMTLSGDGTVLARGSTTVVCTNVKGRPRRIPDDVALCLRDGANE